MKVLTPNFRVKWRVGSDYSCQLKRGGKGIWFCTCSGFDKRCPKIFERPPLAWGHGIVKPLRLVVKSIQEMNLLDVTEEMAKQDGFPSKAFPSPSAQTSFLWYFRKVNGLKADSEFQNPKVWRVGLVMIEK